MKGWKDRRMNFINEPWELGGSHGEARLKGTRAECREKVGECCPGGWAGTKAQKQRSGVWVEGLQAVQGSGCWGWGWASCLLPEGSQCDLKMVTKVRRETFRRLVWSRNLISTPHVHSEQTGSLTSIVTQFSRSWTKAYQVFATPWTAAHQVSLSITSSRSLLKLLSTDAIQPSHPLSSPSPPAFNLSQHQGLFQWVSSSHQVAKVLEFQLWQQSLQWIFRTDFL